MIPNRHLLLQFEPPFIRRASVSPGPPSLWRARPNDRRAGYCHERHQSIPNELNTLQETDTFIRHAWSPVFKHRRVQMAKKPWDQKAEVRLEEVVGKFGKGHTGFTLLESYVIAAESDWRRRWVGSN